jgi:hypothetical protein
MEANVYDDPFLKAREHFLSAVVQLPREYLGTNAAPLQLVITELQRSFVLEMAIIMRIKRLDVTDPAMVQDYAQRFYDYRLTRAYNNERSNCGVIREMAKTIIATLKSGNAADRDRIAEVQDLLTMLGNYDGQFVDDIEQLMAESGPAMEAIEDHVGLGRVAEARAVQHAFAERFDPRIEQLKGVLTQMNHLNLQLLHFI